MRSSLHSRSCTYPTTRTVNWHPVPYPSSQSPVLSLFVAATMRQKWLLLALLPCSIASPHLLTTRGDNKFEWTALGDSYASGVGSTEYVDGRRCLRYDQAWPVLLNGDDNSERGVISSTMLPVPARTIMILKTINSTMRIKRTSPIDSIVLIPVSRSTSGHRLIMH